MIFSKFKKLQNYIFIDFFYLKLLYCIHKNKSPFFFNYFKIYKNHNQQIIYLNKSLLIFIKKINSFHIFIYVTKTAKIVQINNRKKQINIQNDIIKKIK